MHDRFGHGDHVCVLYETEDEQIAIAAQYIAEGLRRGERCCYFAQSALALHRFHDALRTTGIDPDESIRRHALNYGTFAEVYLADGHFDCERMLRLLDEGVEAALNEGFAGWRGCGDMSWLLEEAPGSEQIVEYEALVNHFFQQVRASAMCLYDRRRLRATLIDHALATHPHVVLEGATKANPFFKRFQEAVTREPDPHGVDARIAQLRQA